VVVRRAVVARVVVARVVVARVAVGRVAEGKVAVGRAAVGRAAAARRAVEDPRADRVVRAAGADRAERLPIDVRGVSRETPRITSGPLAPHERRQ
jgi:hypothetical protein